MQERPTTPASRARPSREPALIEVNEHRQGPRRSSPTTTSCEMLVPRSGDDCAKPAAVAHIERFDTAASRARSDGRATAADLIESEHRRSSPPSWSSPGVRPRHGEILAFRRPPANDAMLRIATPDGVSRPCWTSLNDCLTRMLGRDHGEEGGNGWRAPRRRDPQLRRFERRDRGHRQRANTIRSWRRRSRRDVRVRGTCRSTSTTAASSPSCARQSDSLIIALLAPCPSCAKRS